MTDDVCDDGDDNDDGDDETKITCSLRVRLPLPQ